MQADNEAAKKQKTAEHEKIITEHHQYQLSEIETSKKRTELELEEKQNEQNSDPPEPHRNKSSFERILPRLAVAAVVLIGLLLLNLPKAEEPDSSTNSVPSIVEDPLLLDKIQNEGVDINGDGISNAEDINTIQKAYLAQNYEYRNEPNRQSPLLFKVADGETYMAIVEKNSNNFTIQSLELAEMDVAITNGATQKELKERFKGYKIAIEEHVHFFNQVTMDGKTTGIEMVSKTAHEFAHPFDEIAKRAHSVKERVIREEQVSRANLQGSAKKMLIAQLESAIEQEARKRRLKAASDKSSEENISYSKLNRLIEDERMQRSKERSKIDKRRKSIGIEIQKQNVAPREYHLHILRDLFRTTNGERVLTAANNGYSSEPIYKNSNLEKAPYVFRANNQVIYLFSRYKGPSYTLFIATDITDELEHLKTMSLEDKTAYTQDNEKFESDFNNMTIVAKQYGLKNAFELLKKLTTGE